ncbi:MAG: lycopene cyclase domain-containing protein [Nanoarchaeota archaeon]|nr:lycopene cyclase domain-containing protein [Nanoarchaeota archaeon]
MYEYLIGAIIVFLVWTIFFFVRKDLRKPIVWTGTFYLTFNLILAIMWHVVDRFVDIGQPIVPSYWNPPTLFSLTRITGFMGIEDVLFIFFMGGIGAATYEIFLHKKINLKRTYRPHFIALTMTFILFFVFAYALPINIIYPYSFATICGAVIVLFERRDLIKHSLLGGIVFVVMYLIAYFLYNLAFPDFITSFYSQEVLEGISLLGIPFEELLYAFSFGLLWAPLYEYAHGEKCVDEK